jgi:hypothetical protein
VIIWGAGFALLGMWAALVWWRRDKFDSAVWAAGFAMLSALSRPHLCLAPLAFLVVIGLLKARKAGKYDEVALVAVLSLAVMASPVIVNVMKFGTVGVPYERHVDLGQDPVRLARTANSGESPAHIPTQVLNYLRPDGLKFTSDFPYVDFHYGKMAKVQAIPPATSDDFETFDFSSLTATGPLFFLLLIAAAVLLWRRRKEKEDLSPLLPVLLTAGAAVPLLATFGFYGVVERYKADAMPLLVWVVAWSAPFLLRELRASLVRPVLVGAAVLTAYQAFVMFGLGLMAYTAPSDAPAQASLRLDRARSFVGLSTDNKIWLEANQLRDAPLAQNLQACGPNAQPNGERLSLTLEMPPVERRVQTLLQYDGPTVGYARVSDDRLFIILGLRYAAYETIGPLPVLPGTNKLTLQRVGDAGRSCLTWNDTPLTLMDISSPARPTSIGTNKLGSSVTTDDFTGKVSATSQ